MTSVSCQHGASLSGAPACSTTWWVAPGHVPAPLAPPSVDPCCLSQHAHPPPPLTHHHHHPGVAQVGFGEGINSFSVRSDLPSTFGVLWEAGVDPVTSDGVSHVHASTPAGTFGAYTVVIVVAGTGGCCAAHPPVTRHLSPVPTAGFCGPRCCVAGAALCAAWLLVRGPGSCCWPLHVAFPGLGNAALFNSADLPFVDAGAGLPKVR